MFSQAVEPEEEEIELVIIDEVEQETESPVSIPEVASEFDKPAPAPMERPQGMVEQQSQEDHALEEPINLESSDEPTGTLATSTFTF